MEIKNFKSSSWIHESIEIRDTQSFGMAAITTKEIKKGDLVMVFGGHVMTIEEEENLPETIKDLALQIAPNLVIGPRIEGEISVAEYVNHSCDPNCGIKGQISLVALRDIKAGEDITFDYGTVIVSLDGNKTYEFKCLCGSDKCRGKVTDLDWRQNIIQEKYKGYFPYYIQEIIDGLN